MNATARQSSIKPARRFPTWAAALEQKAQAENLTRELDTYLYRHTAMEGLVLALKEPKTAWKVDSARGLRCANHCHFIDSFGNRRYLNIVEHAPVEHPSPHNPDRMVSEQLYELKLSKRGNAQDQLESFKNNADTYETILICRTDDKFSLDPMDASRLVQLGVAPNAAEQLAQHAGTLPYTIRSNALMRDIQAQSIDHYSANMKSIDSGGLAVIATGTGKSFAIGHALNAHGGAGIIVTANDVLATQLAEDCNKCGIDKFRVHVGDVGGLKTADAAKKGVYILTFEQLAEYLPYLHDEMVCIDEPHEIEKLTGGLEMLIKLIEQNPLYFAMTATPTQNLIAIMGKPFYQRNLNDAVHAQRFRGLRVQTDTVVGDGDLAKAFHANSMPKTKEEWQARETAEAALNNSAQPEFLHSALLGYFGSDRYLNVEDNGYKEPGVAHSYEKALQKNRVRYSERKNIAFTIRPKLAHDLAAAYEQIFETGLLPEGAAATERFKTEVAQKRNEQGILAMQEMHMRQGAPLSKDEAQQTCAEAGLLYDPATIDLQAEAQFALKKQICNVINRNFIAKAFGNTPGMVRESLIDGIMPTGGRNIEGALHYDPAHGDLDQPMEDARTHEASKPYKFFKMELAASGADATLAPVLWEKVKEAYATDGLLTLRPEQLEGDVRQYFPSAQYTQTITEEDASGQPLSKAELDEGLKEVKARLDRGLCVHTLNTHLLESGLNDPDIYMTQRLIEKIGPYVVRATQIAGRPLRANDGLALVQDIVGPSMRVDGTMGVDAPFLTERGVLDPNYTDRADAFEQAFYSTHAQDPKYARPDVDVHALLQQSRVARPRAEIRAR